ncbi:Z-ring formation inhibitor MciZ [Paenibacillus urinalis]|uniref:Z-ring formation inhibitor MciZ n=1 Tax=Paenibacillus urinalis TaxID=521520 RepID=A0AAX3MXX4_9BACL|nr:Z-ring formation inhibitor MciZ [Paenibacillus urinalis]WDH81300.1 Z-ring formation inhibitor MciZ [Paenibacillus urinalis]
MKSYKTNNGLFMIGQADQIKKTLKHWISDYGPETHLKELMKGRQAVPPLIQTIKK